MTAPNAPSVQVYEFGEDGEWLAAEGHVDLAEFVAAADQYVRDTWGSSDPAELPSQWDGGPKHTHYRPVMLEDCRSDAAAWYPARPGPDLLGVAEKMLEERVLEGWVYPCPADHAGAEPWTEVRA